MTPGRAVKSKLGQGGFSLRPTRPGRLNYKLRFLDLLTELSWRLLRPPLCSSAKRQEKFTRLDFAGGIIRAVTLEADPLEGIMKPRFTPIIVRLRAVSLFVLAAAIALRPTPGWGQSYCGPATVVNFNVTNGAYPVAGVTFDSQGAMYGTTTGGGWSIRLGNYLEVHAERRPDDAVHLQRFEFAFQQWLRAQEPPGNRRAR